MKITQAVPAMFAALVALTMKTIITSNWRLLHRALSPLLLCIAALWVMPRSARAQLLVANRLGATVGEYNVTTGAAINPNFITGLNGPQGLAISGNNLYVANGFNGVGKYNATTGATIPGFSFASGSWSYDPYALAISGDKLYVANDGNNTVGVYDATTGATLNDSLVTGLGGATGLAVSGNDVWVANNNGTGVGLYDATTGAAIPGFVSPRGSEPFTGGVGVISYGVAVAGDNLYVSDYFDGTVGVYDARTGAPLNPTLIQGLVDPTHLLLSGNDLYVMSSGNPPLGKYDATTGALIASFNVNGSDGLAIASTLPIANAGLNQTVQAGTLVTLDGSASSDPSGQLPLTYAWSFVSQPAGSTAALSNPSIVNPTFTPNALGSYVIQLVVTDAASLSSAPATVTISTTDAPPVANAGPAQTITAVGTLVQLNGSASYDLAGLPITYQWSFVSKAAGSSATLIGPTTAAPSFLADVAGDYSIQLVVTDSLGIASSPAGVTVSFSDVPPVANAGLSQSAVVGETVTLNGSGSTDTDGEPLAYQWSMVSAPSGSTAAILNPTAEIASFVPDLPGTFVVQLIVNDCILNSLPATTEIMAVSQQTSVTQQIHNLQGVIINLPPNAFRNVVLKNVMLIELNAVLRSVEEHHYSVALLLLQDVILPQTNGCATTGAPDRNDWIINCPDQSMVYTPLLNIIAEVRALRGR